MKNAASSKEGTKGDRSFCLKYFSFYYVALALVFCIGLFLRFKAYFAGYTLWLDECSLSLSIIKRGIFGYFSPLEHTQSAPPLFMMLTKILTKIFGINEFSLRLIPFVSSIASIPLFYFVSKKFLNKKYSPLLAAFLFCINYPLVYYSVEFKQYSSDVFSCLLFVLIFLSFNFENSGFKKMFLLGLFSFLGVLFSLPVCFAVGAFVCSALWTFRGCLKNSLYKIFVFLSPFILLMPFYYLFVLYPSKLQMMFGYFKLWQSGFLTLNPLSLLLILKENLSYFFSQNNFVLFGALLFFIGFVYILRSVKSNNKSVSGAALFLVIFFLCIVSASFFKVYPIKERVTLYLLPYLIILIVKPLEMHFCAKEIYIYLMFFFFISSYNLQYFENIYPEIATKKGPGDKFMAILKSRYKEGDILVYNDASAPIYQFNSHRFGFETDKYIMIRIVKYDGEYYKGLLEGLPKGHNYWFYYPYDYFERPVIPFLKEWAKNKGAVDMQEENTHACLLYVKL